MHRRVAVRARVVRAERFAAMVFLALAVVALHIVSVVYLSVAVGAADGVAVRRVHVVVGLVTRCEEWKTKTTLSI